MSGQKVKFRTRVVRMVDRLRGRSVEYDLKPYQRILEAIEQQARSLDLRAVSDQALRQRSDELKRQARSAKPLDDLLAKAYALVREASARTLGLRHFDVQMIAGIALHQGRLVQMQTGEGKTLAAVLPAYLNALTGRGVHLLTFNDYLAARDARWMGPIYSALGLTVRAVTQGMDPTARRAAYRADVTYLTAKEAGYDYLRESIVRRKQDLFLRPYHYAIVDEADSILIDEARVPLVIAGSDDTRLGEDRKRLAGVVSALAHGVDYQTDENQRNVYLAEQGIEEVERRLGCGDLHQPENLGLLTRLNQALHARVLLRRDVDYIVRDGQVAVVDEFTGRSVPDRHWPDGLHRALEAKESVCLNDQGRILSSITMQHFMKLYPKLSGMTGTALPADRELAEHYELGTVVIPPNRPCIRVDHKDVLFSDRETKHVAIVREVHKARERGQPVLIGTSSVRESKQLADRMRTAGIDCEVLNAVNDEAEAKIISESGAPGAVTVSTNMAGRGTDIRLGGADERQRDTVVASGGLYVIGTNRHESRRIDNQLRGRAGRQGDPGMSRFFISLDDHLMQKFGIGDLISPKRRSRLGPGAPIRDPTLHKKVAIVQNIIEGQNLDIRRTLWRYSSYVEQLRRLLHARRRAVLLGRAPSRLAASCSPRYRALLKEVGPDVLDDVERLITLHHIDGAWCDYLAHLADVREAIYLNVVGSRDPLQEFLKAAAESFFHMEERIDAGIQETFDTVRVDANGLDADKAGLGGPCSTWTYLINDNPFEWNLSLASARHIGSGAWAAVLAAIFWVLPLGYWLYRLFRRRFGKRPASPPVE